MASGPPQGRCEVLTHRKSNSNFGYFRLNTGVRPWFASSSPARLVLWDLSLVSREQVNLARARNVDFDWSIWALIVQSTNRWKDWHQQIVNWMNAWKGTIINKNNKIKIAKSYSYRQSRNSKSYIREQKRSFSDFKTLRLQTVGVKIEHT